MMKRLFKHIIGAVAASGLALAPAAAQDPATRSTDALFGTLSPSTPGAVALVARGDQILYAKAFGMADLEQRTPVTLDTRFHVASVSKQFTAFAAALLAREGKIDLDADIRTYLPELPDFGAKITARHLIHHTSGLRDHWELFILSGTNMQSHLRQTAILSLLRNQRELNFAPGSDYRYSNSGYALLAEIVAQASGMPFPKFVKDRIFTPLGMNDSLVYDDASQIVPGRAQSYRLTPAGKAEIVRLNYSNYGATSVFSTASDLLKWSRELLHPKTFDAALIRSLSQPAKLSDGRPLNYGFGVYSADILGRSAIMHGGSDAGFRASFASFPAEDASIIILSNGAADVGRLNEALVSFFLNAAPQNKPVAQPNAAQLAALAGYYASGWGGGVELKAEGNALMRTMGGSRQAAVFRPDGTFEFSMPTLRYRPVKASDGSISAIEELPVIGPAVPYRRLSRDFPSPGSLQALAGDYRSSELDVTYSLSLASDRLVLTSLRSPEPVELVPAERDHFDTGFGRIGFTRDSSGKISGFKINSGRARGLQFVRQSGS